MNLLYISDSMGHTTAVQIPIEDWEWMKKKYKELEEAEHQDVLVIPEWQKELVRKEIQNIENGTTQLLDWEEVKKQIKFR
jgi:hypothetical protein